MRYSFAEYMELCQYIDNQKIKFESVVDLYSHIKSTTKSEFIARQKLTMYWFMMHGDSEVPSDMKYDMIPISENDIPFIFKNSSVNTQSGKSIEDMKRMLKNNSHSLKTLRDIGPYDKRFTKHYLTGLKNLDRFMNGLEYGSLSVFTGDSGSGKSTLLNQIFIAEAIKQNEKVFLFSGELTEEGIVEWLLETIANSDDFEEVENIHSGAMLNQVKMHIQDEIMDYIDNKLYIFTDFSNCSLSNILYHMKIASSKGQKVFILDNLMMIKSDELDSNKNQSKIADELKKFAKDHKAIVVLVAHINKQTGETITKNNVSGSKDITNLADYVFALIKNEESTDFEDGLHSSELGILKNRKTGVLGRTFLDFNKPRRRFCDMKHGKTDRFNLMKEYYNSRTH